MDRRRLTLKRIAAGNINARRATTKWSIAKTVGYMSSRTRKRRNSLCETISAITKSFKNPQTFSFIKYLIDSFDKYNRKVSMPLEEIKEEFPMLFHDEEINENPIFFDDIVRNYA